MPAPKLFMLLIGCKPKGRNTEQHDVYFGIAESIKELISQIKHFWPEAEGRMHIDGWREVKQVDGYTITIFPSSETAVTEAKLFFINLGGYKENEFEEFHYKILSAAQNKSDAINASKKTAFYIHTQFKGADSHIDDKYGVDVDDIYEIEDILDAAMKQQYQIQLTKSTVQLPADELHLGYFKLSSFE